MNQPLCVLRLLLLLILPTSAFASKVAVSSLKPSDIQEFDRQPALVQSVLRYALSLTSQNLGYQYGSNSPSNGGMDCSGTVQHILTKSGFASPRQANTIYLWADKHGTLNRVKGASSVNDPQLRKLQPGDLLFWEGTYNVGKRNPPTSHVMLFLGHKKADGKPVMVGASSGRYYAGKARHGVSVFDFKMPRKGSTSKFVGYGAIPGIAPKRKFRQSD
tara:strand:- start:13348 stop:13998 length:651 start_codon:yes stop_codon:yes gene_type:complete